MAAPFLNVGKEENMGKKSESVRLILYTTGIIYNPILRTIVLAFMGLIIC